MKRFFAQFNRIAKIPARLWFWLIMLATAMAIIGAGVAVVTDRSVSSIVFASSQSSPPAQSLVQPKQTPAPIVTPPPAKLLIKTSFGHLPYGEDDPKRLIDAGRFVRSGSARIETLDFEASQAFREMMAAAKAEGAELMPISGFRSIRDQQALFAQQIQRRGSAQAAARISAPPGYSEHHTGYAIDIADAQQPDTDLKIAFQTTKAYQWLQANADQFGFEESFPINNRQGVSFEPWHWRFTLSKRASRIFATAKRLSPSAKAEISTRSWAS